MVFCTKFVVMLSAQVSVNSVFLLLKSVQAPTRVGWLYTQYLLCQ